MLSLSEKIVISQILCSFFLVFVPLVLLVVLALQGNLTFSFRKVNQDLANSVPIGMIKLNQPSESGSPEKSLSLKSLSTIDQEVLFDSSSGNEPMSHDLDYDSGVDEGLKKEIELKAMQLVRDYEKKNGRDVEDVSMYYVGYDYKFNSPTGFRAIEVKGKARSGKIYITSNEWNTAKELGDSYFLYIVEDTLTSKPKLKIIQNPYKKLRVQVNRVQFILPRQTYYSSAEIIKLEAPASLEIAQ